MTFSKTDSGMALSRCLHYLISCSNLEIRDRAKCRRSGFEVYKFMVSHRVGLKVVFGDTAMDGLAIS